MNRHVIFLGVIVVSCLFVQNNLYPMECAVMSLEDCNERRADSFKEDLMGWEVKCATMVCVTAWLAGSALLSHHKQEYAEQKRKQHGENNKPEVASGCAMEPTPSQTIQHRRQTEPTN